MNMSERSRYFGSAGARASAAPGDDEATCLLGEKEGHPAQDLPRCGERRIGERSRLQGIGADLQEIPVRRGRPWGPDLQVRRSVDPPPAL